jgi:hypothetical protein
MNVNTGRVVLGGLLAGLVLNIGEFIFNDIVLGAQMKAWLAAHNFAEPSGKFIATAVGLTFIMGIVIVFTYALIRSRLGPGVNTAIVAGLISWFAAYLYVGIINGVLFGFTVNMIGLTLVWGLVEYVLAAIAGAWLYKEA